MLFGYTIIYRKITHIQMVAETLNSYFIDKVEELVEKNRSKDNDRLLQILSDCNPQSMYFFQFLKNSHSSIQIKR
jgi:hypothetical protein